MWRCVWLRVGLCVCECMCLCARVVLYVRMRAFVRVHVLARVGACVAYVHIKRDNKALVNPLFNFSSES